MRRLGFLLALVFVQACNCGTKPRVENTHGIVVLSDGTTDVTENDLALSFGPVCLAAPGVDPSVKSFFIKNSGQNTLAIQSITVSGANAASFTLTSTLPASVAPGDQAQVDVAFAPSSTGNESAAVVIATDDPEAPEVRVRVLGSGEVKPPQPTYLSSCAESDGGSTGNPVCSALDFPDTQVGATSTQTLHVTNNGCATLQLTGVSFYGSLPDGGAAFHLRDAVNFPVSIASGDTANLAIDFAPTSANDSYGDLYVTTNGQPDATDGHSGFLHDGGTLPPEIFYVMLNGTPVQANVSLTPSTCTFALDAGAGNPCQPVLVGSGPELASTFLLTNSGNVAVDVSSISVPGDDGGIFSISSPSQAPFTLDASGGANAQVPITVTYHPFNGFVGEDLVVATSAGAFHSHLIAGSPATIVVPPILDFNDTSGDPNTYASPRDLPVQNGGLSALNISGYSFTQQIDLDDGGIGDGPCVFDTDAGPVDRFVLVAPPGTAFPLSLAPGDTSTWTIAHQPDTRIGGSVECALHIPSNDPGTPDANVRVLASTFVNCDPASVITPDNLSTGGNGITLSGSVDGGVFPIDGSGSFDTDDATSPRCPNGRSNGLQIFDWKLTGDGSGFPFGSRLETAFPGQSTCLQPTADAGCTEWRTTLLTNFPPYDAASVNVIIVGADQGHPQTLSLTVTDTTGRRSSTDVLKINAVP